MLHTSARVLNYGGILASCSAVAAGILYVAKSTAQSTNGAQPQANTGTNSDNASPIYGVTIPPGYRDWKLIAVDHLLTDKVEQLRAQLGNEMGPR